MLEIRNMLYSDKNEVLPMVCEFYGSDAVDHDVSTEILEQTFTDATDENNAMLQGYVLVEQDNIIGFAYLTQYYACEVAGINLMIEELFIKENARGNGYGKEFMQWVIDTKDVARFRLEVTANNEKAVKLYENLGFEFLSYDQMIKDI